ncbi:MAG TPA: phosphate ABC transporter permease subunit PstC, partial [Dehalococcoidia bacterium]|nr:phosphate ABC transporter permease subunit PstC [Dehalococcoidia bacterium]
MNFKLVAEHAEARRAGPLPIGDWVFRGLVYGCGLMLLAIIVAMVYELVDGASLSMNKFGVSFLWGTTWNPVTGEFGALPLIFGTIATSLVALVFAVPLSIGTAVFIAELAPRWLRAPTSYLIEVIAAIPSVILGFWGLFVLVPFMREHVQPILGNNLGFIPLFEGPQFGLGILTAGIILSIMVVPIITAVARDIFLAVPNHQREAMLALGATRWEVVSKAVLPYSRSGLIGAVILGLGRAIGETMAVTMVIGNSPRVTSSLFAPQYTMAAVLANEFAEASGDLYLHALVEIGLVLFTITLIINVISRLFIWSMGAGRPRLFRQPARK